VWWASSSFVVLWWGASFFVVVPGGELCCVHHFNGGLLLPHCVVGCCCFVVWWVAAASLWRAVAASLCGLLLLRCVGCCYFVWWVVAALCGGLKERKKPGFNTSNPGFSRSGFFPGSNPQNPAGFFNEKKKSLPIRGFGIRMIRQHTLRELCGKRRPSQHPRLGHGETRSFSPDSWSAHLTMQKVQRWLLP